jgi:hypothetical protein
MNEWKLTETNGIMWVRLVHDRSGAYGIGFCQDQLVYFLGNQITHGLVRRVSAFESIVLLRCLAGRELAIQPDIESHPVAWRRWLAKIASFPSRNDDRWR